MALVIPDVGERAMLARILGTNLVLHLFTNNRVPAESDTVAAYTEMSGMGYAAVTLNTNNWTIATVADISEASYPAITFTFTEGAGSNVYGYYVTDVAGTTLFWSERFASAPFVIPNGGGTITITPSLRLD